MLCMSCGTVPLFPSAVSLCHSERMMAALSVAGILEWGRDVFEQLQGPSVADAWWRALLPLHSVFFPFRKYKPSLGSHVIIKVQKSQVNSSFVERWNLRPLPAKSGQASFKITAPNMLPSTWFGTGSLACTWRITKSHSSPVHVN